MSQRNEAGISTPELRKLIRESKPGALSQVISGLDDLMADALLHDWGIWARDDQCLPDHNDWFCLYWNAGRGFGKTRSLCEGVRHWIKQGRSNIALIAQDAKDARDVLVEGPSGLKAVCWQFDKAENGAQLGKPHYSPSLKRLEWENGARAFLYSSEDPEELRGPQFMGAACDELAKWSNPQETWDQLMFGMRLPNKKHPPQVLVATTPRPKPFIKELKARKDTIVINGSTFDNAANLAPSFLDKLRDDYEGTRLGRQELYAEYLDDMPGSLWTRDVLEKFRVKWEALPAMRRIVIGIDPAISTTERSDETGIVACGIGVNGRGYVLADISGRMSPDQWSNKAATLFDHLDADKFVIEVNQGGDMVRDVLRSRFPTAPIQEVRASRGKFTRAEPVAALYEQGRISHVGVHKELESQMVMFTPDMNRANEGYSPDRVDALVWAFSALFDRMVKPKSRLVHDQPKTRLL